MGILVLPGAEIHTSGLNYKYEFHSALTLAPNPDFDSPDCRGCERSTKIS